MGDQNTIDLFAKIFSCYGMFLIAVALIFNPFVTFMCIKSKKLRSTSTFKLLAFSAINDLICLLGWNQEGFAMAMFNYAASFTYLAYCRWVSVFMQYSSLQFASWMMVSISLDRLLSVSIKKWSKNYFAGMRPVIYASILALLILALNFNEIFTSGYILTDNGTDYVICYETDPHSFDWYDFMNQWFVYFGFVVPYALLLIINSLIIFKATGFARSQKATAVGSVSTFSGQASSDKRKSQMTRTILFITFLFIAMSLPGAIVTGYFYGTIYMLDSGALIINVLNAVQFSYPAYHFFILFFSNKLFAQEVKSLFARFRPNSVTTSGGGGGGALRTQKTSSVPGEDMDKATTKSRTNQ